MATRRCPTCNCNNTIRFGKAGLKQRYRCKKCGTTWMSKNRTTRTTSAIWKAFVFKKLPIGTIAKQFKLSSRTIRNHLNAHIEPGIIHSPRPVVIVADATYFGRSDGKLAVIDPHSPNHSLLYFCNLSGSEKLADYEQAVSDLINRGYHILGAVIDGRRGVRRMMEGRGILVQHCQFHQLLTITQCLTKRPKLPQNIELKRIASKLTTSTQEQLRIELDQWHSRYGEWLKESYIDPETNKNHYQHEKSRRAYFSLRRNLHYLYTYQNPVFRVYGVTLPNTTNALDGRFGACKRFIKVNPRLSKQLKTKIFFSLLSGRTD